MLHTMFRMTTYTDIGITVGRQLCAVLGLIRMLRHVIGFAIPNGITGSKAGWTKTCRSLNMKRHVTASRNAAEGGAD